MRKSNLSIGGGGGESFCGRSGFVQWPQSSHEIEQNTSNQTLSSHLQATDDDSDWMIGNSTMTWATSTHHAVCWRIYACLQGNRHHSRSGTDTFCVNYIIILRIFHLRVDVTLIKRTICLTDCPIDVVYLIYWKQFSCVCVHLFVSNNDEQRKKMKNNIERKKLVTQCDKIVKLNIIRNIN